MRNLRHVFLAVSLLAVACAPATRPVVLPEGPATPFPDYQEVFGSIIDECRQVRTMEFALGINGRTGDRQVRGRVRGAVERPGSVRLEGLAPFGAPAFVLVADAAGDSVLVLPRDRRVVTHEDGGDLLGSLTGLVLGPADFAAVLTGCVMPDPRSVGGRSYRDEWQAIDLEGGATIYLRPVDGVLSVAAATRDGMAIEYSNHVRGLPRVVRVRATDPAGVVTDLTATLSQVSINIELQEQVFVAPVRDDYVSMTLEEFRRGAGPLDAPVEDASLPR